MTIKLFEPPQWYNPFVCENCSLFVPPKIVCGDVYQGECKHKDGEKCPTLIPKKDRLKIIENNELTSLEVTI